MRTKATWILILTLGLPLAFGTAWGFALSDDPAGPGRGFFSGRGHGMKMLRMLDDPALREELALTDEQVSRLRVLAFEGAKTGLRTGSEVMLKRLELEELLQADEPDRAAIEEKLRELSGAQHALLRQRIEHRLTLQELLTPEQRTKMRSLRRHRPRGFRQRGERQPPMRGPRRQSPDHSPGFGPDSAPEAPPSR